ncbi:MAG: hypothetical protein NT080_00115 [Spirochaetes bacterium]|nr:hypothetical protein [Spirochaetota bacterium]
MTVEIFALCDFAQDVGGKLTVVGAFDTIFVRELPARHPLMSIALRLRFPVYELGDHAVRVTIRKSDGDLLIPAFEGKLKVNGIGNDSAVTDLAIHLNQVAFERTESLKIVLEADGAEAAVIPLYVRLLPQQAGKN